MRFRRRWGSQHSFAPNPWPPSGRRSPVDFVRAGVWSPVNPPLLELIESTHTIRSATLIRDRITERTLLPAQGPKLRSDEPMDFVRAGLAGPVDRTVVGKMIEVAAPSGVLPWFVIGAPSKPSGPPRSMYLARMLPWTSCAPVFIV